MKIVFFFFYHSAGVGLAILEKAEFISPIVDSDGATTSAGTVSAGYQNFCICLEMLFAAIALRYAFPYQVIKPCSHLITIIIDDDTSISLFTGIRSELYDGRAWSFGYNAVDFE